MVKWTSGNCCPSGTARTARCGDGAAGADGSFLGRRMGASTAPGFGYDAEGTERGLPGGSRDAAGQTAPAPADEEGDGRFGNAVAHPAGNCRTDTDPDPDERAGGADRALLREGVLAQ